MHLVIPDTQIKPGVPTVHLEWIGRYIVDQFADAPLTIVHLGDHYDMPSLSSYDKGMKAMEGRRYVEDVAVGDEAFDLLDEPIRRYNRGRRRKWKPRKVFLHGNHENRITRAVEANAQLDGLLSLDQLAPESLGWEVHPFLEPVWIDGVCYAHYFYQPMTGRAYGGTNVELRLKTIGHSFTMGHQQGLLYGLRSVGGRTQHGLVAGSCYLHDEEYRGPQANHHWRGIVVCHQVEHGSFDPMFVGLDFLCRKYEGKRLSEFQREAA